MPVCLYACMPSLRNHMLLLHPRLVRFGAATWDNIAAVAIDRAAHKTIEEWTDAGPYAALADVPEQRTRIRITQEPPPDHLPAPAPGEQAQFVLFPRPPPGDASRRRL